MIVTRGDLLSVHGDYARCKGDWDLYLAAFEGTRALVELGALQRHSRESEGNFARRQEQAISFNYSRSVVEILLEYLFERSGERELGALGSDEALAEFLGDVDFLGTDYDRFWYECQQFASVLGHVGVLVAKPGCDGARTVAEERSLGVRPCLSRYLPQAILDWRYQRDERGRPALVLLKVVDDDGTVRVWTPTDWEVWEPVRDGVYGDAPTECGVNPLGRVPWVWHRNGPSQARGRGKSDIEDVARIDVSIMRNMSQADEVVDLAAFPMLLVPREVRGEEAREVAVGPSALLEFDPHAPDGRPSWLRAEVLQPLEAILNLVRTKVREVYRMTNTQGEALMGEGSEVPSGRALEVMFRQLNARLASKADALEESELGCLRLWAAWQGQAAAGAELRVRRPRDFRVRDLAGELANLVQAGELVGSARFGREVQKAAVSLVLPQLDDRARGEIVSEIEGA